MEEVGFGVKGHSGAALDDEEFEAWAELKQILESFGFGHIEVIAGDDTHAAWAIEEVLQMPSEQIESTLLDECHREVDLFGPIDRRFEIRQKRIEFASCKVAR